MKIPAIRQRFYYLSPPQKKCSATGNTPTEQTRLELPSVYYPCSTIFGIANSAKLKTLFSYGLPSIYSGDTMIDPRKVSKMLKNGVFEGPIAEVMKRIEQFEESLSETELNVYRILKEEAKIQPNKTVSEVLKYLAPDYQEILTAQQNMVFHQLGIAAQELPEEYRYKFVQLMQETKDKQANRPVEVRFSRPEFKYRLEKIQEDVSKMNNLKANKVMIKLIEVDEKLTKEDDSITDDEKLKTVEFMEKILKTSVLKNNQQLKYIFDNAKSRLKHEKILIPFARKTFIYDLKKVLEGLPNEELTERMLGIAESLPTSRYNTPAYIMKFQHEPSEKIIYRLLWPFMASVEHLYPRACGGIDEMSNFAGACTRENSDRGSIPFTEQLKRVPKTPIYCQQYVDRLIELYKQGIFEKHYIDKKYIEEFKNTIFEESEGKVVLDISKLYE